MSDEKEKGVWVTQRQVQLCGSHNVARFLAQCLYWSGVKTVQRRQGWFYKSRTEWQAETWLSRYQQEKARAQLKDMGLLEESHERMNTGIRLWFRLNTALYYALLNKLPEQSEAGQMAETGKYSDVLYDSTLTDWSENKQTDYSVNYETLTDSSYTFNNKTIVLNTGLNESYKPENSTIVLDNNNIDNNDYSDNHCVEIIEDVEIEESVEADASPLSGDLDDCPETIDPELFLFCHPFIYQFVRYCRNEVEVNGISDVFLKTLSRYGFGHYDVQAALCRYVELHGHAILEYYRQNTPMDLKPLTRDDLDEAIRAFGRV